MQDKMLTIIVPAYNVQKYVGQCLESLVRQTCDRYKVIIVDDGSKDANTSTICKKYAAEHPQLITYVRQENKGLGAARNTGLRMVKTPYVSFLDSDDWLDTRFVEYVIDSLERYDDDGIDIIFTLPKVYDNITGHIWDWMDKGTFDWIFPPHSRVIDMGIDERPFWLEPNACRRVFRTDFLSRCNFTFPEGTRWEDVYPHFYLLTHAKKCLGVPEVGFFYRTNVPTSITSSSGRGRLEVASVFAETIKYLLDGEYSLGIMNSALRMCVNFSTWSISMAQDSVRTELVEKLHELYASIPEKTMKDFLGTPNLLDNWQRMFINILRSKRLHKLLCDYQMQTIGMSILERIKYKR